MSKASEFTAPDGALDTHKETMDRISPYDEPVTMHLASDFGAAGSADWRAIADDLAAALERLDGLYRSEQDADAPTNRPAWLSDPLQRYRQAA